MDYHGAIKVDPDVEDVNLGTKLTGAAVMLGGRIPAGLSPSLTLPTLGQNIARCRITMPLRLNDREDAIGIEKRPWLTLGVLICFIFQKQKSSGFNTFLLDRFHYLSNMINGIHLYVFVLGLTKLRIFARI